MRKAPLYFLVLAVAAAVQLVSAQTAPTGPNEKDVFYVGAGVVAPELMPSTVSVSQPRQCDELDGVVKLSALIDPSGAAHDIKEIQTDDARLADFSVELVSGQRFKPGMHNDAPVAVAVELTVGLRTCVIRAKGSGSNGEKQLILRSHPFITIGLLSPPSTVNTGALDEANVHISAPVPISTPHTDFPDKVRKKGIGGICVVGLIVNAQGMPQNIHIDKKSGSGAGSESHGGGNEVSVQASQEGWEAGCSLS